MAKPVPWLQPGVACGGVLPAVLMGVRAWRGELGANPISQALNELGLLALTLLIASLACTPAQKLLQWTWTVRIRRTLGLLAFGYVTAHFLVYLLLDLRLDLKTLLQDLAKRPFITVGFLAWLLLIPIALTSTDKMIRRLGFVKWKRLHRLAYVCAGLGAVHFIWRVKKDLTEPLLYAFVLVVLLGLRAFKARKPPVKPFANARV